MSRIDELIAELAPNGVGFEPLGNLIERGTSIRWSDAPEQEFQYIDLTSVNRTTHSISNTETVTSGSAPSRAQQIVREGDVLFGTTRPMLERYCVVPPRYDRQIASTGFCVLRPKPKRILTSFLFHLLGTPEFYAFVEANERGASYPAIPDNVVKEFRVPVPPLEVQREIASILDQFTQLEAELEAELEARRQQYAYFRHSLVAKARFSSHDWVSLGGVASIRTGQKPDSFKDVGSVPYINAGNEPSGYTDHANAHGGVLTIPSRGQGSAGHVGFQESDFWCGPLCYRVDSTSRVLSNKFLYYYLKNYQDELIALRKVGSIPAVNKSDLGKVLVPLADVDEQLRIVDVLDRFEALTTDLSTGLPAELSARRKQYEFYRDRLLTFKEAV